MAGQLEGKVAIVTGGGRGIGARYCRGLAGEGARVVVADINPDGAEGVAREVGGLACRVDVSEPGSVQAMVAGAVQNFGRVDVLINNAAIFSEVLRPPKTFDQIPEDEWDRVMAVNVRGVFLCCKAVAPLFKQQRSGVIVNISSGTIYGGQMGFMHYVTSKGAVWAMSHVLVRELAEYGVRVNAIAPGLTSSEVVKDVYAPDRLQESVQRRLFKREQTPEDLVGTVIFLCSDASAFITGQTFNVDGGSYLS